MADFWEERGKLEGILAVEPCAVEGDRKKEEKFRKQLLAWTTMLMSRAQILPAHHLLDLGCGFGDVSVHLAPYCAKITAVDGSSSMIENARQTIEKANIACDWTAEQGNLATFDRIEGDVDLVYLGAVCMYITEDEYAGLIGRIAARAAKNVAIVQREYVALNGGWTGTTEKGDYRSHRRTPQAYIDHAARAGFRCDLLRYSSDMSIDLAMRGLGPVGRGLASGLRPVGRLVRKTKKEGSSTFILRRTPV